MATPKQIAANRNNARLSTGPRSPEGKAVSSQNGISHGLTAKFSVLSSESPEEFEIYRSALQAEYRPQSPSDVLKVEALVSAYWRLRRIPAIETAVLEWSKYNPPGLSRPETAMDQSRKAFEAGLPLLDLRKALREFVLPNNALGKIARHESHLLREIDRLEKALAARQTAKART